MKQYGLIGYPLSHSFSPGYFNNKFRSENIVANYQAYPLESIDLLTELCKDTDFAGLNVTIPYKESVIPYLDSMDIIAQNIGAVNTIKFYKGKTIGYNTDAFGFETSLLEFVPKVSVIKGVLVLGSGGASKAVCFVLDKLGIPFKTVSRSKGNITYKDIDQKTIQRHNLIINATPVGMYPYQNFKPEIPYHLLNEKYFLYDLIYNPEKTIFLAEGIAQGCTVKNGYDMLTFQAEKSWEIWNQPEM
ncbi:MAG: shikimate dehydrogenase [Saprospiraceae bacterium]|nr:shikimate dehydrogenase [Saprospiraceae bacterium]